ncbi:MAG: sigma-54-dependent Fis family transcriptional regulator [Desulfuromonas sp.]|nr:sigma-54-dependent Fis family transcriptional regulator [Desulfuromonas sp.]
MTYAMIWQQFIETGTLHDGLDKEEIKLSWQRCRDMAVDPYDGVSHQLLSPAQITTLLDRQQTYVTVVRHFMQQLYEFVKGSGFIVFLANRDGYILETMGDPDTFVAAAKVNLIQGACWSEAAGGTNGIGTALSIGRPVQVSGCEHYCQKLHPWTCSAAPLYSEIGEIRGVLQMSGPSAEAHSHTLGMVVASAEAIRKQLGVRQRNRELVMANAQLSHLFQTMSDGALVVDDAGLVLQMNPVARKVFGKDVSGQAFQSLIHHADAAELLGQGQPYKEIDVVLDTESGAVEALMTLKPLRDDKKDQSGAVVFFNPIRKMKKLVNRFGGAQATFHFTDIIGEHRSLQAALRIARKAADNLSHVLILGESGTGKELLAQAIHNQSARRNGPFLALNCAALPRDLIASELFGYISGAFTGASPKGRPGKFEMASGGTLLLDEIGDMPLDQQATLLRVLQDKQVTRLGSERVIGVDVRVICATNKDLLDAVNKGHFRQDLYYRLNVTRIDVPPLRERGNDIELLFKFLQKKISKRLNLPQARVEKAVIDALLHYEWPGNVRELENVVERMIHSVEGEVLTTAQLPAEISRAAVAPVPTPTAHATLHHDSHSLKQAVAEQERRLLVDLLQRYHGNISLIARDMAVSRNTIYRKIHHYGISRDYSFD